MVINIASLGGRTHMLDTARELEKFGHTVRFYSYVPTKRAMQFGLKKECSYSLFLYAIPFLLLFKLFSRKKWNSLLYQYAFDYLTAWYMKPCDVFIGQSPLHRYTLKYIKKKYNAIVILERGTSHILEFINILSSNPEYQKETRQVKLDLEGYTYADYISVGAQHVLDSFIKYGYPKEKIFVNNYGFDYSQFYPTKLEYQYDLLFVGGWSYRKGADLITKVCERKGYKFLHVGSILSPFPQIKCMHHIDAVEQSELIKYYTQSKVFILPSREEGLAMVQLQAMACGLPLVCSPKSGGKDLKKYVTDSDNWIIEVNELTIEQLIIAIEKALSMSNKQTGIRCYAKEHMQEASWTGYGKRYNDFLINIK